MFPFIWILFAHYMGDYALQSDWMAKTKQSNWYVLVAHCMIWTSCISTALEYNGLLTLSNIIFLFLGHLYIDYWKIRIDKDTSIDPNWVLACDQIGHLYQCLMVSF